ncbi:ester cyclase [Streptomyces laurentii]|uniref:ester cyclase n=1 Tax=Streptomyces laurentii TaxID=39478 RepID=UPI0036A6AC00
MGTQPLSAEVRSDHYAVMRAWTEAINRRELEASLDCYADDGSYEDVALGKIFQGRQTIEAVTEGWFEASHDLHLELGRCFVSGDIGAMPWTMTGTLDGRIPGLPDDAVLGSRFDVRGVDILEFADDGRVQHGTGYWSVATLLQQIGCSPHS